MVMSANICEDIHVCSRNSCSQGWAGPGQEGLSARPRFRAVLGQVCIVKAHLALWPYGPFGCFVCIICSVPKGMVLIRYLPYDRSVATGVQQVPVMQQACSDRTGTCRATGRCNRCRTSTGRATDVGRVPIVSTGAENGTMVCSLSAGKGQYLGKASGVLRAVLGWMGGFVVRCMGRCAKALGRWSRAHSVRWWEGGK